MNNDVTLQWLVLMSAQVKERLREPHLELLGLSLGRYEVQVRCRSNNNHLWSKWSSPITIVLPSRRLPGIHTHAHTHIWTDFKLKYTTNSWHWINDSMDYVAMMTCYTTLFWGLADMKHSWAFRFLPLIIWVLPCRHSCLCMYMGFCCEGLYVAMAMVSHTYIHAVPLSWVWVFNLLSQSHDHQERIITALIMDISIKQKMQIYTEVKNK